MCRETTMERDTGTTKKETLLWKASRKIDGGKYSEFQRHLPPSRRHTGRTYHHNNTLIPPSSSVPQPSVSPRSIPIFNLGQDLLPNETDGKDYLHQQQNIKRRVQTSTRFPGRSLTTSIPMTQPVRSRPTTKKRPNSKVILEYTVTQGEYIIDAVVVKEPFRDRFEVYGIDVLSGQRFELFIPSEAVFDILSGDMLVTAIENPTVWKEVVQRITLLEVDRFSRTGRIPQRNSQPTSYSSSLLEGEEEIDHYEQDEEGNEIPNTTFPLENQVVWSIHDAGDREELPDDASMEKLETANDMSSTNDMPSQPQPHPPPPSETKKRSDKPVHPGREVVVTISNSLREGDSYPMDDKEGTVAQEMDINGPETTHDDGIENKSVQPLMSANQDQSVEEDAVVATVSTGAAVNENVIVVSEAVNNTTTTNSNTTTTTKEAEGALTPTNALATVEGTTTNKNAESVVVGSNNKKTDTKLQPTKPSMHSVVHKPRAPVTIISSKRRKGKGTTTKKKKTDDVIETTEGLKPVPSSEPSQQPSVETKAVTFAEKITQEQQEIPTTTHDIHSND